MFLCSPIRVVGSSRRFDLTPIRMNTEGVDTQRGHGRALAGFSVWNTCFYVVRALSGDVLKRRGNLHGFEQPGNCEKNKAVSPVLVAVDMTVPQEKKHAFPQRVGCAPVGGRVEESN